MDKIDLANRIFNSQNHEDRSNGERPISSFKSATATSDSEDGYVTVVFDERNVQTDAYGAGVKLPTIGNVTKGQQVLVASVEKNGISTLTVLGSNGSGDIVASAAKNAQHMAMTAEESMAFVKQMAQSADKKADQALSHSAVAGKTYEGICTTSTPVAEKTLTVDKSFTLVNGTTIIIGFKYGNSAVNPTLNVNNTGAKPIMTNGMPYAYCANETRTLLLYDGTNWQNCGMQLYGESLLLGNPKEQNMLLTKGGFQLRTAEDPYAELSESGLSLPTYTIQKNLDETIKYTSTISSDIVDLTNTDPGTSRWFEKRYDILGCTEISYIVPQMNGGRLRLRLPLDNYQILNTSSGALAPYMDWAQVNNNNNGDRFIILSWTVTPRSILAEQGVFATDIINNKIDFTNIYSVTLSIIGYYFKGNNKIKWFEFQNRKLQTSLDWLTSMTAHPNGNLEPKEFFLKGPKTIDLNTLQSYYPDTSNSNFFVCVFQPYKLMKDLNLYKSFVSTVIGTTTPEQDNLLMQYSSSFAQAFQPNVKTVTSTTLSSDSQQTMVKNGMAHIVTNVIGNDISPQYNIEVGKITPRTKANDYYEGQHGYSSDDQEEHLNFHLSILNGLVISSRIKNMNHPTNLLAPLESKVPIRSDIMTVEAHNGVSFFGRQFLRNVPPYALLWCNLKNVTNVVNGQCRYPIGAYHLVCLVCCGSNDGATTEFGNQNIWTIMMMGIPTGLQKDMNTPFNFGDAYDTAGELHCSSITGNGNFYSASLKYDGYTWSYDIAKVYHWGSWKSEQLQIQKIYGLL